MSHASCTPSRARCGGGGGGEGAGERRRGPGRRTRVLLVIWSTAVRMPPTVSATMPALVAMASDGGSTSCSSSSVRMNSPTSWATGPITPSIVAVRMRSIVACVCVCVRVPSNRRSRPSSSVAAAALPAQPCICGSVWHKQREKRDWPCAWGACERMLRKARAHATAQCAPVPVPPPTSSAREQ
jgi:hypothetical protein